MKRFFPILALAACSSSVDIASQGTPHGLFSAPADLSELSEEHFFDHPFPSDLRVEADGTARYEGVYNPRRIRLIQGYLAWAKGKFKGFSPAAGIFFRFDAPVDPASLPNDPGKTADATSSVQIVDVDPKSKERGKRKLLQLYFRKTEGTYWLPNTLSVLPLFGQPLRPNTRYAVVVTRKVKGETGAPVAPSPALEEVLGLRAATPATARAREVYGPAIPELAAAGVQREDIANLTVFTTGDPADELYRVADALPSLVQPPDVAPATWAPKEQLADFDVYEGIYGPSPNFQAGVAPYAESGGNFVFGADGKPVVQGREDLRFALTVPNAAKCPPPAGGYPIVLHAHGTGGDYRSHVDPSGGDRLASSFAAQCLASMGIDQPFHGTRAGSPPQDAENRDDQIALATFNFSNPDAGRTNFRQAAIDVMQQARLFTENRMVVPAATSRTGAEIRFDGTRVLFFGHSQGSLNGTLFLAADKTVRGGVLSGSSALSLVTYIEKTKPEPSIARAVKLVLGVASEPDELNFYHPILSVAQAIVDPADPLYYFPSILKEPRPGAAAKSVFLTEGVTADGTGDNFTPPRGIEIASLAIGVPRLAPGIHPIEAASWLGLPDVTVPAEGLSGNLAGGQASGVIAQFVPPPKVDGHFVVFYVPAAKRMAGQFLGNLAADPKGKVPAP